MKIKNIKIKFTKLLTVLLTLCMILSIVPITAYSAETEVSGEKPLTNNYTHTYHTNIKVTADVKIIDQSGNLISTTVINKESGFLIGNVSDAQPQAELKKFNEEIENRFSSMGLSQNRISEPP